MKFTCFYFFIFLSDISFVNAQKLDSLKAKWDFSTELNGYFIPQNTTLPDFILLPVIRADKNKLHLEARYNYEDINTFSSWIGYNIKGGKKLEYAFTTMLGGVIGNSNGFAPGLEMILNYKRLRLYSEMEYMFNVDSDADNFYYNWTDLTFAIKDWLWIGASIQRTKLYQTDFILQRGPALGAAYKNWEIATYFNNIDTKFYYTIITVVYNF